MNHQQFLLITSLVTAACLPSVAAAAPVTVTITGAEWTVGDGWGAPCTSSSCDSAHSALNVGWSIDSSLAGTVLTFNNVNDSQTVTIGSALFSEEDGVVANVERDALTLSGMLKLASPNSDALITGATTAYAGNLRDQGNSAANNEDLAVSFSDIQITLASGARINVQFPSVSWICEGNKACTYEGNTNIGSKDITATFTLIQAAPATPVSAAATNIPEPSSLLLAGLGFLGLTVGRRKLWLRR